MKIKKILPQSVDWGKIPAEKISGTTGVAEIKKQTVAEIQIRLVEYSKKYFADHWCEKGHILFIVEGDFSLEHSDESVVKLYKGMSYFVGDDSIAHRASSVDGAKVFIVD